MIRIAYSCRPTRASGTSPNERPGGIPGDLGRVAEIKSTTDVERGYDATWRGEILKTQRKGLTLLPPSKAQ